MINGYIFKRFVECRNRFIKQKVNPLQNLFYFSDWLFAFIIHGASINDYFAYRFHTLRNSGRKEYITYRRHKKIQNICNSKTDKEICRSKIKFNNHFAEYLNRDWLDLTKASLEEFKEFISKYDFVFLKNTLSYRGIGVEKLETKDINIPNLYSSILSKKKEHFILEEEIKQIKVLSEYHPWSINTIRVVTLYDDKNDKVYIMNARLRMGNKKNSVDNFHYSGIGANIDIESGIINSEGYDMFNETYLSHPLTGRQIIGNQIPLWKDCKNFVEKAVRKIPTVRYVGWDIVLDINGKFLLIEANDNADHDFQQMYNRGLWKDYKSIINKLNHLRE